VKAFKGAENGQSAANTLSGKQPRNVSPKPKLQHPGPIITCFSDIDSRPVNWLWHGRIALGRITLLGGMPGAAKSFLTCDMAARISTGTPWPDGSECDKGSVILLSAEDDPGDTIRPRLDAHRADVNRVHLLSGKRVHGPNGQPIEAVITLGDVETLRDALKQISDCKLVVIDPVGSYLGGRTDAHRDNEVRAVLAPIAKLAEEYGVAVLIVVHFRKASAISADDMVLGSRGFTGIARAVHHLIKDPDDPKRRLLLLGKTNLTAQSAGLAFEIIGDPGRISWEQDPVEMTADEAIAKVNKGASGRSAVDEAEDWLKEALANGRMPTAELTAAAKDAGISAKTLERAKKKLRVKSGPSAFGEKWQCELPGSTSVRQDSPVSAKNETLANTDETGEDCDGRDEVAI